MNVAIKEPGAMTLRRFKPYPSYKDSGVQWLGKIPVHWNALRIKRVFSVVNGSTPQSAVAEYWDGDIPWVTPEDLGDLDASEIASTHRRISDAGYRSCGTTLVPAGSLVLSTRAPIGHLAIAGVDLCTNQGCRSLVFRGNSFRKFFFYQLVAARSELESLGEGSTFRELAKNKLEDVPIAEPSESEQRAIAAFLDRETAKIDALVAKKERLIELLQEKRTALISRAVTKGLDPNVPMKDSSVEWLGKIPAHWKVRRLAMAVQKITNGFVGPTRDILVNEGTRYLQSLHIKGGAINFDRKPYYVTDQWSNSHAKSVLRQGDVLVVQTGDIGQVCAVPAEFDGCNCHALIILRLKSGAGSGSFLSLLLQSDYGHNKLRWSQTGALHPHLECGHIREIPVPLPPASEQQAIVGHIEKYSAEIDDLVAKVRDAIERLKELRTALISAAVKGKIDVRERAV